MIHSLLQLLFPSPCVSCGYLGKPLCDRCFKGLEYKPHVRVIHDMKVYCSMFYEPDSILEHLIHPFKYKHQAGIFRCFVPRMRDSLKLFSFPEDCILVPVPLHTKRRHERGYNQAELLAKWIAKQSGADYAPVLRRTRYTDSQALSESKAARIENLSGAFRMTQALKHGQVLLVDDIVTTGSTLLACADALRVGGVKNVSALALANRELQTKTYSRH
jgi:ComF family protein